MSKICEGPKRTLMKEMQPQRVVGVSSFSLDKWSVSLICQKIQIGWNYYQGGLHNNYHGWNIKLITKWYDISHKTLQHVFLP